MAYLSFNKLEDKPIFFFIKGIYPELCRRTNVAPLKIRLPDREMQVVSC